MVKRLAVVIVILGLVPSSAFAQSFRESTKAAVARMAQSQPPPVKAENPYKIPAIVLWSAGGGLLLLGMTTANGVECSVTTTSSSCGTTHNVGLIVGGLGAAGVGTYLYMKGEKQRNPAPTIAILPGGISVAKRFRF